VGGGARANDGERDPELIRVAGMGSGVAAGSVGDDVAAEKGNVLSSKTTWREIMTLRVERSKQRYPFCSRG
jgi:hypothetical protein